MHAYACKSCVSAAGTQDRVLSSLIASTVTSMSCCLCSNSCGNDSSFPLRAQEQHIVDKLTGYFEVRRNAASNDPLASGLCVLRHLL